MGSSKNLGLGGARKLAKVISACFRQVAIFLSLELRTTLFFFSQKLLPQVCSQPLLTAVSFISSLPPSPSQMISKSRTVDSALGIHFSLQSSKFILRMQLPPPPEKMNFPPLHPLMSGKHILKFTLVFSSKAKEIYLLLSLEEG